MVDLVRIALLDTGKRGLGERSLDAQYHGGIGLRGRGIRAQELKHLPHVRNVTRARLL